MSMQERGQRFVVVIEDRDTGYITSVVGPYRSFKRAEGVAKAEDFGCAKACVMPLEKPQR